MTEHQFLELADRTLAAIEDAVDACGASIETSRSGHVLELEFDDGSKIVVNAQAPMRELWVAARAGGFHFRREGERWLDSRGAGELWAMLSELAGRQAGEAVELQAPADRRA